MGARGLVAMYCLPLQVGKLGTVETLTQHPGPCTLYSSGSWTPLKVTLAELGEDQPVAVGHPRAWETPPLLQVHQTKGRRRVRELPSPPWLSKLWHVGAE